MATKLTDKQKLARFNRLITAGRKGGQSTSPAKVEAARANALKGAAARKLQAQQRKQS